MDSQPQTGLPPVTMSGPGLAPALAGPGCVPELDPGGVDLGTHMGVGGMDSGLESMWSPPPTPLTAPVTGAAFSAVLQGGFSCSVLSVGSCC